MPLPLPSLNASESTIGKLEKKSRLGSKKASLTVHPHFRELSLLNQAQLRRVLVHSLVVKENVRKESGREEEEGRPKR